MPARCHNSGMPEDPKIRIRDRYTGRVQGVGFRATCRWVAESHPVTGWVRNEHDGSVLLEVQGELATVEAFLNAVSERLGHYIIAHDRISITPLKGEKSFGIAR